MTTKTTAVTLPRRYFRDWLERYDGEWPTVVRQTERTMTLEMDAPALADLIDDVRHYTDLTMRDEFTSQGYGGLVKSAVAARRRLEEDGVL